LEKINWRFWFKTEFRDLLTVYIQESLRPDRRRPIHGASLLGSARTAQEWRDMVAQTVFSAGSRSPQSSPDSRPYLSITGANMCVTLSIMLDTDCGPRIFCLDLDWSEQY